MSLPLNHEQISQFLQSTHRNPTVQKETGQNFIIMKVDNQDLHVFFVILADNALLQIIGYFPFTFLDTARSDLSRLLHLLNKEVDMPGFGMDEMEKLIFYRVVIPCTDKKFDPNLVNSYLNTMEQAFHHFYGTIGVIACGTITFDSLLEEGKKALNNKSS